MTRRRPNVLFILADDMGYGDFGLLNGGLSYTPRLDALVSEGLCLTQHYAASPVCSPSRAGLITGRYPHRTGCIDTLECRGLDRLATRETTLADVFKRAGYATGVFGKWHHGAFDRCYHPNQRGFDEFLGFRGGWSDYYLWRLDRNGIRQNADGRYLTDVITTESVGFIERHAREPFFLNVAYNAPHTPLQAPIPDVQRFVEAGKVPYAVCVLYGMLQRLDAGVEQLLAALDRSGIAGNTIVVFTSDNGPQFVSEMGSIERFNSGLAGRKGLVYDGGIRVPAIIRWPDGLPVRQADTFMHMTDWFPTLAAMAGLTPVLVNRLDGINLLPALRGERDAVPPTRFWQWNRYTPLVTSNAAMREGPWKLVRPALKEAHVVAPEDLRLDAMMRYEPDRVTGVRTGPAPARQVPSPPPPELYNLAEDPNETRNLADREPGRVWRMLAALETWFEAVEAERAMISESARGLPENER